MKPTLSGIFMILAGSLALAAPETEIHCTDGSRIRGPRARR